VVLAAGCSVAVLIIGGVGGWLFCRCAYYRWCWRLDVIVGVVVVVVVVVAFVALAVFDFVLIYVTSATFAC